MLRHLKSQHSISTDHPQLQLMQPLKRKQLREGQPSTPVIDQPQAHHFFFKHPFTSIVLVVKLHL